MHLVPKYMGENTSILEGKECLGACPRKVKNFRKTLEHRVMPLWRIRQKLCSVGMGR